MGPGSRKLANDMEIERAYTAYVQALAEWRRKPAGAPPPALARVMALPGAQAGFNTPPSRRK